MGRPKIETFKIYRHEGRSPNWAALELHQNAINSLNDIGETGKLHGVSITEQEFLDKYVSNVREHFLVEILPIKWPAGRDSLLVIRVTLQ